ncbi:MAG: hypothetical protein WC552_02185 [Candidatus Omnitrophota bacterium]
MKSKLPLVSMLLSAWMMMYVVKAQATAPSQIFLDYDQDNKMLHVEVKHVSQSPRTHYIRKLVVYQNDQQIHTLHFSSQTSATAQVKDVPLEAGPGDNIRVLAVCSEAGRGEGTLVIPEE